jgi:hypothetical protein
MNFAHINKPPPKLLSGVSHEISPTSPQLSFSVDMSHLTSCGMGLLLTVDPGSGIVLWTQDLGVPVTGIYTWHQDGLHQLPHLTLARDTLHFLVLRWGHIRLPASSYQDTATQFSSLDTQLL